MELRLRDALTVLAHINWQLASGGGPPYCKQAPSVLFCYIVAHGVPAICPHDGQEHWGRNNTRPQFYLNLHVQVWHLASAPSAAADPGSSRSSRSSGDEGSRGHSSEPLPQRARSHMLMCRTTLWALWRPACRCCTQSAQASCSGWLV